MKKLLVVLVSIATVGILTPASLANDKNVYKLYDTKTNKSYPSKLITIGNSGSNVYSFGLMSENAVCMINMNNANKTNGYWRGECTGMDSAGNMRQYKWAEFYPNTLIRKMAEIKMEKEKQGLYLDTDKPRQQQVRQTRPRTNADELRPGLMNLTN
ncbi:MAG: hypothetical protein LUB59_04405 [Candidatus Gastranaerophilales bacterium]|nr:hypothetical protein [Candidatus Gastranaerophilales bacterium]